MRYRFASGARVGAIFYDVDLVGQSVGQSPSTIAQRLIDAALSSGRQRDDIAILVLRIRAGAS